MSDKEHKDRYKDTINLPATRFPMKANLAQREPELLAYWQEIDLYKRLREAGSGKEKFILHDGPPYANGTIHIGHALNKIIKDIIVKSKTLSGYDAPYVPGWDCHGLPIELEVEKKVGRAGAKVDRKTFRQKCREFAAKQVAAQKADFIRLGVIGDWGRPYLTMDPTTEANILRALTKIIAAGHVYHGAMPVYWCTDCRSALAEAEVEYMDKTSPAVDVRFSVVDVQALLEKMQAAGSGSETPVSVVIWTTTPWTLPANQAVTLHPELEYVLVECETGSGSERLLLADALLDSTMTRCDISTYKIVARATGSALEGVMLRHPFYAREVPLIVGEHVTTETGTGAVHTAPGHGQEDFEVGRKYGLKVDNPVGPDGVFLPSTELFAGQFVFKANGQVNTALKERGMLLHEEPFQHSYPHCWRHKTPIVFRATPQWFISMDQHGLRESALQQIDTVAWYPDWGKARIAGMVQNRPDWCISRQRSWGVPIAVYINKETGELHPKTPQIMEEVALRMERSGIDAWFDIDDEDLLGKDADDYEKVNDILDVWFDSGVTHDTVVKRRRELGGKANMYLEGSDQHRGWFQSSLLTGVAMNGEAPYREVLTHGFTVDAAGKKMSKSLGNVVVPQQVIKTLGADILRLWVAATDYRAELSISDEILKRMADSYRRMRNTARYLLGNLADFDPAQHTIAVSEMLALDRWALGRAQDLQTVITRAYEEYNFHVIYQRLHQFCVLEMGGFYLDVIKDRLYTMRTGSIGRRSAQTAMYHILEALVRWLAPILSFTAEEIWREMPGERNESVMLNAWYEQWPTQDQESGPMNRDFWNRVLEVREAVNRKLESLREAGDIGANLEAEVDIYCDRKYLPDLQQLDDELRFVMITSNARAHALEQAPGSAEDGIRIDATPSKFEKCVRCWHRREDVGSVAEHPQLCLRCLENVSGAGEARRFA